MHPPLNTKIRNCSPLRGSTKSKAIHINRDDPQIASCYASPDTDVHPGPGRVERSLFGIWHEASMALRYFFFPPEGHVVLFAVGG